MTGKKFDSGKADLSLNPKIAQEEMAFAFMLGEKKYGRFNFYKGLESHRLISAAMRHLNAWNEGENLDPESGRSHLGHALACIAMILKTQELGSLRDTRYVQEGEIKNVSKQDIPTEDSKQYIFIDEVPDSHIEIAKRPIYDRHTNSSDDEPVRY